MRILTATTSRELAEIASELHDSWIDLPTPQSIPEPWELTLLGELELGNDDVIWSIGALRSIARSKLRLRLMINGVSDVEVQDHASIGRLNISNMRYDDCARTIQIRGAIPVVVIIHVVRLDVRVEITDEVVAISKHFRLRHPGNQRCGAP